MADLVAPLDEWKECRAAIGRFDGYIADLRKVSFGLIPTAIGITAFLTRNEQTTLSDQNKAVIASVIILLVTALFAVDRHFGIFRAGAVERALDIEQGEDRLGPELLTGAISRAAIRSWSGYIILAFYLALTTAGLVLGQASIQGGTFDFLTEIAASLNLVAALLACILLVTGYRWYAAGRLARRESEDPLSLFLARVSAGFLVLGLIFGTGVLLTRHDPRTAAFVVFAVGATTSIWYFIFTDTRCGADRFRPALGPDPTVRALRLYGRFATLTGDGFGTVEGRITMNGMPQTAPPLQIGSWSDGSVTFQLPAEHPALRPWQPGDVVYVGVDVPRAGGGWTHSRDSLLWTLDAATIARLQ